MTATMTLPAGGPPPLPDASAACNFLRSQKRWLVHGLLHAEDPVVVATILEMHDSSHHLWLLLLGSVRRFSPPAARQLTDLYAYHGLIAGSLERNLERDLAWTIRARVCSLLARRLEQITDDAVDAVESLHTRLASLGELRAR